MQQIPTAVEFNVEQLRRLYCTPGRNCNLYLRNASISVVFNVLLEDSTRNASQTDVLMAHSARISDLSSRRMGDIIFGEFCATEYSRKNLKSHLSFVVI